MNDDQQRGREDLRPHPRRVARPRPPVQPPPSGPDQRPPAQPLQPPEAARPPGPSTPQEATTQPPPPRVPVMRPDLDLHEVMRGSRPGNTYVRIYQTQARARPFRRRQGGVLEATQEAIIPASGFGRTMAAIRRFLVGAPLASAAAAHERLTKVKALAVFSSDALSSVAYATQEILLVLAAAGTLALHNLIPIQIAIVVLLTLVAISYRQTIRAYPSGGGSYIVARDNLGDLPGLTAGASLMIDYTLTVAVSISSGVAAITSAFPALHPFSVELALLALAVMVVGNLRGVRESGSIFAAPTYLFLISIFVMIAVGIFRTIISGGSVLSAGPPRETVAATEGVSVFLILRAFASGCTALTGVEAISNGVPAFKPPESKNAATTLVWMAIFLGTMFMGIGVLAHHYGIVYTEASKETVLSQIAETAFHGRNALYYIVQFATMLILVLAANTSFADFPRLSSILAKDGFMPHAFTFRGDRLAFSNGILVLAALAGILIVVFRANTDRLIPLYAVGVFAAFTLSQSGMVVHWRRLRERGWRRSMAINGTGAIATAIVTVIIGGTKFVHGAWLSIVLTVLLVLMFQAIQRHYRHVAQELELPDLSQPLVTPAEPPTVVVPVMDLNVAAVEALSYARTISPNVTAIHVTDDLSAAEELRDRWQAWAGGVPLVIIDSPYRSFNGPLLRYLDEVQRRDPNARITVVLPEYVPKHLWEHLLHNQTALRLKAALLFRPHTVVIDVPHHGT
jgi:amino acid transporter